MSIKATITNITHASKRITMKITVRAAATLLVFATVPAFTPVGAQTTATTGPLTPGKYGCTESHPRMRNGSWEYDIETRGFITLAADGNYVDPFKVAGTYRYDAAKKGSVFTKGALDGALVTPMKGNRLWVVIPTAKGERRWACGKV